MANVLLLEDNPDLLSVVQEAIELSGHDVRTAQTGKEGLELLAVGDFHPDAIICDIMMPDMDGLTFLRHIRQAPRYRDIFFIMVSGNGGDRDAVIEAGADEYLAKPFSIITVNTLIEAHSSE
ncbi:response regulator [Anaerolineae bacterium CFX9]|jgi:two-component system OmpR family response regulator|nr:response regulator [Anaerolineae bacterium CFX9]